MTTYLPYRDVVIVGGGVVGLAIAQQLTRHRGVSVTLLEARPDVGAGTSKANTAILHTGFDATPDTIESRLVARGHELLHAYGAKVGIPIEPLGALLVAWDEEQRARFPQIVAQARANGYDRVREIPLEELRRREPHLGPGAIAALEVPDEHIVCPFTTPLAYAYDAVQAGLDLRRSTAVTGVERVSADGPAGRDGFRVDTTAGALTCRFLVNAAGLRSDVLHRLAGHEGYTVTPRRGELLVFDKLARPLVNHVLLPVPTATTKGVLVSPTVFGNVLLGPTADDVPDKDDRSSTPDGIARLLDAGARIVPELLQQEITQTYVGLRAATEHKDYQLELFAPEGYVSVGGIRSTGLTASLAIGEEVCTMLAGEGLELDPRDDLPELSMPNIGQAFPRPFEQEERIAADPAYGEVVCFCERVTRGEIRDALDAPVPPVDVDGLRRRTRATLGRCQAFYCGARVDTLLGEGCEGGGGPAGRGSRSGSGADGRGGSGPAGGPGTETGRTEGDGAFGVDPQEVAR